MAGFRLTHAALKGQFAETLEAMQKPIARAATGAIKDAIEYAKVAGRANIASAGFSSRWQNALRGKAYPARGASLSPAGIVYHKIPYAGVFETGATIPGSPLLWLPLPDVPTNAFGKHMSPANFVRLIGPLRSVFRPGKPPLLVAQIAGNGGTKITAGALRRGAQLGRKNPGGKQLAWVPVFYGLDKVQLGKKFNLTPIFEQAKNRLGEFYLINLRTGQR